MRRAIRGRTPTARTSDDLTVASAPLRWLPVWRRAVRADGAARARLHLPLPDVPESIRPAVHGFCNRQARTPELDARHTRHLPELEPGPARVLQGLRDAADVQVRGR